MDNTRLQNELWKTTFNWLRKCGYKINSNFCKEEITTHPDYPALTSVIDFLNIGGLEYKAVQANKFYIQTFKYPLLAHLRKQGQEFMHVIDNVTCWDKDEEVTQYWTGIVLYPINNTKWENEKNNIYRSNSFKNKLLSLFLLSLGIAFFIFSTFLPNNIFTVFFGGLSLIGIIISIFLVGMELGVQNQIVKQICGIKSSGGCENVLNSVYARGIAGITPSDFSGLYFLAQFIIYIFGIWYPFLFGSILLLSFTSLIVAFWSIYTQAIKLKSYCALCLSIVAVLFLQCITSFILYKNHISFLAEIWHLKLFLGLSIFILLLLFELIILLPIKNLIKVNQSNVGKLGELKKWKSDVSLFILQLNQQREIDTTIWDGDLIIGNLTAPLLTTVVCNPYCSPCAKTHKHLDNLFRGHQEKIKIQIRLLCNPDDEYDQRTIAAKAILQKSQTTNNSTEIEEMLMDWFEWMNYDKWINKWSPDKSINIDDLLYKHAEWIKKSNISYTPTIFFNGRQMPEKYSLEDTDYLFSQLILHFEIENLN